MGSVRQLFVFLSSPADVGEARRRSVAVLDGIDRMRAFRERVSLAVVSWDDPAEQVPAFLNQTPQQVVNEYKRRPSECDLCVVIFGSRLGTRLPIEVFPRPGGSHYRSGTEWEVEDAMAAGKPVLAYRWAAPRDAETIEDDAQLSAVESFLNDKLSGVDGALRGTVCAFDTVEELARRLEKDVSQWLDKELAPNHASGPSAGERGDGPGSAKPGGTGTLRPLEVLHQRLKTGRRPAGWFGLCAILLGFAVGFGQYVARGQQLAGAEIALREGRVQEARADFEAVRAGSRWPWTERQRAVALVGLGDTEQRLNLKQAARSHYESAQQLFERAADALGQSRALAGLLELEADCGSQSEAQRLYERGASLLQHEDSREARLVWARLATELTATWPYAYDEPRSRDEAERAAAVFEREQDLAGQGRALLAWGNLLRRAGDPDSSGKSLIEARKKYDKAGAAFDRLGDERGRARSLLALGWLEPNPKPALESISQARLLFERSDDRAGQAEAWLDWGDRQTTTNDRSEAYDKAIQLSREARSCVGEARSQLGLAIVSTRKGELRVANEQLDRALELALFRQDPLLLAVAYRALGGAEARRPNPARAREHYQKSLAALEKAKHPALEASVRVGLAVLLRQQNQFDEARAEFERIHTLFEQCRDRAGLANVVQELGRIDLIQGRNDDARAHFRDALALLVPDDKEGQILPLQGLATVEQSEGHVAAARDRLGEALALAREAQLAPSIRDILYSRGLLDLLGGDPDRARKDFEEALDASDPNAVRERAQLLAGLGSAELMLAQIRWTVDGVPADKVMRDRARAHFDDALKLFCPLKEEAWQEQAAALAQRAITSVTSKDMAGALAFFARAREILARHADIHRVAKIDDAVESLKVLKRGTPSDPSIPVPCGAEAGGSPQGTSE